MMTGDDALNDFGDEDLVSDVEDGCLLGIYL